MVDCNISKCQEQIGVFFPMKRQVYLLSTLPFDGLVFAGLLGAGGGKKEGAFPQKGVCCELPLKRTASFCPQIMMCGRLEAWPDPRSFVCISQTPPSSAPIVVRPQPTLGTWTEHFEPGRGPNPNGGSLFVMLCQEHCLLPGTHSPQAFRFCVWNVFCCFSAHVQVKNDREGSCEGRGTI